MDLFSRSQRVVKDISLAVLFFGVVIVPLGILLNAGLFVALTVSPAGLTVLPSVETLLAIQSVAAGIFFGTPTALIVTVAFFAACYGCIKNKPTIVHFASGVVVVGLVPLLATLVANVVILYFYRII